MKENVTDFLNLARLCCTQARQSVHEARTVPQVQSIGHLGNTREKRSNKRDTTGTGGRWGGILLREKILNLKQLAYRTCYQL